MNKKLFTFLCIFFLLGTLVQCAAPPAPVYVKNGEAYGVSRGAFRGRWWNYYERGLSYAEGKYFEEAVSDLKKAVSKRDGDRRMARTYGMHTMDYFPHRELGAVYYQKGNLLEAQRELQTSLGKWPSAKARYYLDLVRKGLIEKSGTTITPPSLTLDFLTEELWTKDDTVLISGHAEDHQYIAAVWVGRTPVFLDGSKERVRFREAVSLPQGMHVVTVKAANLFGETVSRSIVVHVDRKGPIITIDTLEVEDMDEGKAVHLQGFIDDESGVQELRIDGRQIPLQAGVEAPFSYALVTEKNSVSVFARDRLGNRTTGSISLRPSHRSGSSPLVAFRDAVHDDSLLAGLFSPGDRTAPHIRLDGWTHTQKVYLEKVFLEGQASDEGKIVQLKINGEPILRREGRHIFFSHVAELQEGENHLLIAAEDEDGNVFEKRITVIRKVPKALQLDQRLSVSILPFQHNGLVSETSLAFHADLSDALMERNRFQIMERHELDLLLEEQKLSLSEVTDKQAALRLGRIVAAQCILMGTIVETRAGLEIVGRVIDTETSETLAIEDVYMELEDDGAVSTLAEGMAIKIHHQFPLVDGLVLEGDAKSIVTDLGQKDIKLGRRLIVYRERPVTHPETHIQVGSINDILGHARVTQVMPNTSMAELHRGKSYLPKPLDKVITQ